jgi:TonB family protein
LIGTGTYVLADGSEQPSDRFILRELRVGDHIVKNVIANVAPVKGDPLLGQSFLSKLPSWTIDNARHVLVFNDSFAPAGAEQAAAVPVPPPAPEAPTSGIEPPAPRTPAVKPSPEPVQRRPEKPHLSPPSAVSPGYRALLGTWLENHKRYPDSARQRGEEGRAVLHFAVDRSGRVVDFAIAQSSGYSDLDASVEDMMRGAVLPPFPAGMTRPRIEVSVAIRFSLAR